MVLIVLGLLEYLIGHHSDLVVKILHYLIVLTFKTVEIGHVYENVAIDLQNEMATVLYAKMHLGVLRLQRLNEFFLLHDCLPNHFF